MTDHRHIGTALALSSAATTTDPELEALIQGHLNLYSTRDVVLILAQALAVLAGEVYRPIVDLTADPDEHREHIRQAVLALAHGPAKKEK